MSHRIFRLFLSFIIMVGLAAVTTPPIVRAAGPWYVATTGDDNNDCLSPATPCSTLSGAINKASSADTILVAEGTYIGTGSDEVLVTQDLTLSGGWDATFTTQSGKSIIDGEGVRRGLQVNGSSISVTIENFIIQNSFTAFFQAPGAIFLYGNLTLRNSSIQNNQSIGIYYDAPGTTLTLENVTISNNISPDAPDVAGGLQIKNTSGVTINNSIISGNSGSGIFNESGPLFITDSVITNNSGAVWGAGIRNGGNLTIRSSSISNNITATGFNIFGGGIYNSGTVAISNSTISSNASDGQGGGIYQSSGTLILSSSTISANSAVSGGGIYHIGNTATLRNTIVAGNLAQVEGPDCWGSLGSAGHNLLGNNSSCNLTTTTGDMVNIDPLLSPFLPIQGYHPLMPGSPTIDAGNPAGCTDQDGNPLTSDQRGVTRVGTCDIGAYEYTTPGSAVSIAVASRDHQRTQTSSAFPYPLQVAALDAQGSPVGGISVDFTAPGSGPSGTFSDTGTNTTTVLTGAGGVATTSTFTANDQPGTYAVSASSSGLGSVVFNLEQIARPANDNLANAEVIPSLPFSDSLDITNATLELNEPSFCGATAQTRSVWYSFTPATSMVISADAFGSGFSDTNLSVFQSTGPGFGGLGFLRAACSGSSMLFAVQAGTTYYLQAQNYSSGGGDLHINLAQVPAPANDNFADAAAITSLPFSTTVDLAGATTEPGETFICSAGAKSAWYVFTPTENTTVRVDMTGSQAQGAVGIYRATGSSVADLAYVACSYSGISTNIRFEAGEIYYLQMASDNPGTLQLNLEQITPPANDNFADAEAITGFPFSATTDNTNATTQPGEPQGCSFPFRSVWYTFIPTENMALQLHIDSQVSAAANIFVDNGSGLGGLTSLICAYVGFGNSQNFQVEAGSTYYLRVDTSGQPATIQIDLQPLTPPANDRFDGAEDIAALPFSATRDNTSASMELGETSVCGFPFRSVWYAFTPSETMLTQVQNTSQLYGAIDVFRADGPGFAGLTFLGCAFNGDSTNIQLEAGQTYYLRVDSNGVAGVLQFTWDKIIPPANDDFANAEEIGSLPFNISVNNSDATIEANEPFGCGVQNRSLWYSFTPTENVAVRANTAGSTAAGLVEIYLATGPGISDLTPLGCAANSSIYLQFEAGRTYYLKVDSFGQAGLIQVNLETLNPPANDNFANAEIITTRTFHATANITDATTEPNESAYCYFMPNTVWYSFTPAETVRLRLDTFGGIFGNVTVYRAAGAGITDLQFQNCSGPFNAVTLLAEAGQTYYFQVGAAFGETGNVQFNMAEIPNISGRVIDSITGLPLPGSAEPFTWVNLYKVCGDGCLEFVNSQSPDGQGRFVFESYSSGPLLSAGTYRIEVFAMQYQPGQFGPFEFTGSNLDVGDLALDLVGTQLQVSIDILPDSATNIINLRSATIPVAILSSDGFNAVSDVNRSSLTFGKTGSESSFISCNKGGRDVNQDGRVDLICNFRTTLTGLIPGDVLAILRGSTFAGLPFEASGAVEVIKGRK